MKPEDERRLTVWFDKNPGFEIQSMRFMLPDGSIQWLTFVYRADLKRYIGELDDDRQRSEIKAIARALKTKE